MSLCRFTFPQVPRKVSDAIYGRVQGAEYDTKTEMWLIPCDMEVNVTLKFGGVEFPLQYVHMGPVRNHAE